ncbi:unnamed protein product [Owenia fusiformis]|uniref:PH domain-containing protein n=1 Tax=Owenia fusiformis TaxID=6347 RepID=A0A8S4NMI8_OWEFU|nr:unnamed protein product [Owenia fusiformis]
MSYRKSVTRHSAINMETSQATVIKQGYLKKAPNANKFGASFKKWEKRWFVFCVKTDYLPYLEYYENEDSVLKHEPINTILLANCQHILQNLMELKHQNTFTITLEDRVLHLVANSRMEMEEWIAALNAKLKEMGIIKIVTNDYDLERLPMGLSQQDNRKNPRDPTSPLPEPPEKGGKSDDLKKGNNLVSTKKSEENHYAVSPLRVALPPDLGLGTPTNKTISDPDDFTKSPLIQDGKNLFDFMEADDLINERNERLERQFSETKVANNENRPTSNEYATPDDPTQSMNNHAVLARQGSRSVGIVQGATQLGEEPIHRNIERQNSRSLSFFHGNTTDETVPKSPVAELNFAPPVPLRRSPGGAQLAQRSPSVNESSNPGTTPHAHPPLQRAHTTQGVLPVSPPPYSEEPPPLPPYSPRTPIPVSTPNKPKVYVGNAKTGRSLTQTLVENLNREIEHPGGVKIMLRQSDCYRGIALVDAYDAVWVAGWNQLEKPHLHNAFHIGDRIVSIGGHVIESSVDAQKIIKHSPAGEKLTFIAYRAPYAKAYAIKRSAEGQSLGIKREGGTSEILLVDPQGLAAKVGVPLRATSVDKSSLVNWCLTEINMRPLNLFFKESEIEYRLNAVGKDISLVLQPIDFVAMLKKQLKKLKNYKDFLVQ